MSSSATATPVATRNVRRNRAASCGSNLVSTAPPVGLRFFASFRLGRALRSARGLGDEASGARREIVDIGGDVAAEIVLEPAPQRQIVAHRRREIACPP